MRKGGGRTKDMSGCRTGRRTWLGGVPTWMGWCRGIGGPADREDLTW